MKLKTIRMNPDRHARLKALAQESGFKTMGKYLESLLEMKQVSELPTLNGSPSRTLSAMNSVCVNDEIEAEVKRRMALLSTMNSNPSTTVFTMNSTPGVPSHTLEDCARTMIDMLPEATRNFAYEVCEHILHIQPSQLIHGHLMNAADSSLLQSPHIDPSWEQRKVEEKAGKSICEWHECRQPFEPEHYGQRYCGNICGGKAATEMLPKAAVKTRPILDAPGMQNLIAV